MLADQARCLSRKCQPKMIDMEINFIILFYSMYFAYRFTAIPCSMCNVHICLRKYNSSELFN